MSTACLYRSGRPGRSRATPRRSPRARRRRPPGCSAAGSRFRRCAHLFERGSQAHAAAHLLTHRRRQSVSGEGEEILEEGWIFPRVSVMLDFFVYESVHENGQSEAQQHPQTRDGRRRRVQNQRNLLRRGFHHSRRAFFNLTDRRAGTPIVHSTYVTTHLIVKPPLPRMFSRLTTNV